MKVIVKMLLLNLLFLMNSNAKEYFSRDELIDFLNQEYGIFSLLPLESKDKVNNSTTFFQEVDKLVIKQKRKDFKFIEDKKNINKYFKEQCADKFCQRAIAYAKSGRNGLEFIAYIMSLDTANKKDELFKTYVLYCFWNYINKNEWEEKELLKLKKYTDNLKLNKKNIIPTKMFPDLIESLNFCVNDIYNSWDIDDQDPANK